MKKTMLLAIICLASISSFAQRLHHGLGINFISFKPKGFRDNTVGGGITYAPYFCFRENDKRSLSVGIPLTVGFGGNYYRDDYKGDPAPSVMVDIPVMLNFNMGCGSSGSNRSRFGFFAGGGLGFHYQGVFDHVPPDEPSGGVTELKKTTWGPGVNAGIRYAQPGCIFEYKLSFMQGISGSKAQVFGIGCIFNFR
ncbi:hypothetical protein F0L74_07555 [Chitinophaga agrisoli]|uniref:Outer membrane protein with beta-barrel domain n=1 Tax=Chitinophaga agrisoli TaxID=2607653 RepID=A0A5B2VUC6_9BACT|nr:hypothetical protein [Chitinophaga agrisoli]KAA2242394.1 hypothetical protein F0L74_07555 [Chitinophaga agrisoli]